jgi:acetylornithine deacetylase
MSSRSRSLASTDPVSEAIHGYDERVDVESICRITKSIALFAAEWCGVAEAR